MIIRRHGYDRDREVKAILSMAVIMDDIQVCWVDCLDIVHVEKIQEIHREFIPNKIILFTSENW
jgi:predicted RNA-binding protein with EMAP domain